MSTEKHDAGEPTPPTDWRIECEKHWKNLTEKRQLFWQNHQAKFTPPKLAKWFAVGSAALWLSSGFYKVDPGYRAVVTRFGAYSATLSSGLHWHWPYPLEDAIVLNVGRQRVIDLGSRDSKSVSVGDDGALLTSDDQRIRAYLAVQYQISDPKQFIFSVNDIETSLRKVLESVERSVVARYPLNAVMADTNPLTGQIKQEVQTILDKYQAGIRITAVNMQDVRLPENMQQAFNAATKIREEKSQALAEAEAKRNETLGKARSEAARSIQEAEAFATETVAKARGETERFEMVLAEYQKSPAVTSRRLELEAKEKVYSRANKIVVYADQNPGFYLPMQQTAHDKPLTGDKTGLDDADEPTVDRKALRKRNSELRPSRSNKP